MYTIATIAAMTATGFAIGQFATPAVVTAIAAHTLNRLFWWSCLLVAGYFDLSMLSSWLFG